MQQTGQVYADYERKRQVLLKQITNTFKYPPNNKKVIVTKSFKNQEVLGSGQHFGVNVYI